MEMEMETEQDGFLAVKRGRKRSWVGVKEEKPHAYLREAMVSGLMDGICNPDNVGETLAPRTVDLPPDRSAAVADAVGTWQFSAHDFSEDELLRAATVMLQHALIMPDLERWRIPTDDLDAFVLATRMAYNSFVPYHNFRHVVDVLQAVFYFLLQLGALPPYPPHRPSSETDQPPVSPIASLLRPFEALTLLITAIGHDVGHPGVNNAFLVNLKAPLAQLYNDRSVLESFHCAAFSQLLRRYWPASFQAVDMRKLLINTILATDMGLHFDYMTKLGHLQEKLHEHAELDGWDGRTLEEHRTLTCSLIIKCADISNVARKYDVAAKWASILTDEFARQASMEVDLGIPTALFTPPIRDSILELGKSQIGFMNLFALPLFLGVADILPAMQFSVDEIQVNKQTWEAVMAREAEKERGQNGQLRVPTDPDGMPSPRSRSLSSASRSPELNPPAWTARASPSTEGTISPRPAGEPMEMPKESTEMSTRSSMATLDHLASILPEPSRRLSLGSREVREEEMSRRSSGAYPGRMQQLQQQQSLALRPRRSSNTVPTQLQLGMASSEHQRSSADHSLVAVLVTSPGKSTKTTRTSTATTRTSQQSRPAKRNSSEKSSLPSSTEWQSQTTSPTNITYSPTTEATSFLSETSSEKGEMNGGGMSAPALPTAMRSGDGIERSLTGNSSSMSDPMADPMAKVIRQRPSRWKLNFWKNRRKTASNGSP